MGLAAVGYASLAATVAAAGVSTYSAISQGNAQAAAADYNAKIAQNNSAIAQMNANSAVQQGNQQLQAAQEQAAQHQGMIRSVMGAGSIQLNGGSALRDQEGVAEVDQLNQATIVNNAARSAWNFKNQGADYSATAGLDTMQAQQAETGGLLSGFGSAISGAGQFGSSWLKYHDTGVIQ